MISRLPAAFRRLCVETPVSPPHRFPSVPAAFRRLCVETPLGLAVPSGLPPQPPSGGCVLKPHSPNVATSNHQPAAFRRLCVETINRAHLPLREQPAAFRRLCVETATKATPHQTSPQPPSGGCVLKHQSAWTLSTHMNQPPSGGCVLKQRDLCR